MAIHVHEATEQLARGRRETRRVRQDFRCARCGYGVALEASPPECPMCRSTTWEPAPWRPFTSLAFPLDRRPDGVGFIEL